MAFPALGIRSTYGGSMVNVRTCFFADYARNKMPLLPAARRFQVTHLPPARPEYHVIPGQHRTRSYHYSGEHLGVTAHERYPTGCMHLLTRELYRCRPLGISPSRGICACTWPPEERSFRLTERFGPILCSGPGQLGHLFHSSSLLSSLYG